MTDRPMSQDGLPRHLVRQSFNSAAKSYDQAARLQRQVCHLLMTQLGEVSLAGWQPQRVLDAGCGTGYGLGLLRQAWPAAQLLPLDFAPAMLAMAGGGGGICADVMALPLADQSVNLYWSSLTWQWCDLNRVVAEASRVLAPSGRLAVSTLAQGTLHELSAAFAPLDGHRHVLNFAASTAIREACQAAGFADIRVELRTLKLYFADLPTLLRDLKALGAHQVGGPRRPGLLGRAAWCGVVERYEAFREPDGLPASYEVVLCTATK